MVNYGMWDQSKGTSEAMSDVEIKFHRDDGSDIHFQEVIGYAKSRQVVIRLGHSDVKQLKVDFVRILTRLGIKSEGAEIYFAPKTKHHVASYILKSNVGSFDLIKEATKVRDAIETEWKSDQRIPRRYINGRLARPDAGKSELED